MDASEYVTWVEQAAAGDLEAFSHLVKRFQNIVTGAAFGWLGDIESARDVSQEAFLEAYSHLHELREPIAFPAWLRRIVFKHCDRLTRRKSGFVESLDVEISAAGETLEAAVKQDEEASAVRLAVGRLPPQERIVVALTYFAELSGTQAAEFLEIPLSTVKQRLRTARALLQAQGENLMQDSLQRSQPSHSGEFSDLVNFFLAVRQGHHARVRNLLRTTPALVDAVQEWEPDLVTRGVLPFATRATALITAIERDDLTLLQLLLDAGADADGCCECATGESPVWAATLFERPQQLQILLEHGADANRASNASTYPLHVAAMRGQTHTARLLLVHGADPRLLDRHGNTAADWARANGHQALADVLVADADQLLSARTPDRTDQAPCPEQTVLYTGIKALDLFCPLPLGGLIRVPFMAGVGMVVLMGELCERVTRAPSGRAIWAGFAQRPFDVTDWRAEMSELGILDRVEHSLAELDASLQSRRDTFDTGLERALELRAQGFHVLLILLSDHGFEADVEAAFPALLQSGHSGSITTLVITPFPQHPEATWPEPRQPFAAQLRLDRALAKRNLYPAIEPTLSWSRALTSEVSGSAHLRTAQAASALLSAYARTDPDFAAITKAAVADPHFASEARSVVAQDHEHTPAIALLHYLAQPFYVAEPFTGRQGTWVDQNSLLAEVNRILGTSGV